MNRRVLFVFLIPILLVGVSLSSIGVAVASHWTPHGTPIFDAGWAGCRFDTLQLVYYTNNTSTSVALEKAGQWISPTGSCDINAGEMKVIDGNGNFPSPS